MRIFGQCLAFIACLHSVAVAQNCLPLSDSKKSTLLEYVRKEYRLKGETNLTLSNDELAHNGCYRELVFEGKSSLKTWQITLYLSPDQRFLTDELFDTTVDPIEEQRRQAATLMSGLAQNKGSSRGPDQAAVTIVEFSDFECPFCRKFADLLDQALPEEKGRVRVVFHHMPLSNHPWARTAAEGAACAQLQSGDAFWKMHDQIFTNQASITPENVKSKLQEFARTVPGLQVANFQNCLQNEMSLGLILRDLDLASANGVNATPTLFINGNRITGVKDAKQLQQLITEAEKEANQAGSPRAVLESK
jgi:protein-disulfide isomerase